MMRLDKKRLVVDINIPGGPHQGRIRFEIDTDKATSAHYEAAHAIAGEAVRRLLTEIPPGGASDE